jgi:hypothetical protein
MSANSLSVKPLRRALQTSTARNCSTQPAKACTTVLRSQPGLDQRHVSGTDLLSQSVPMNKDAAGTAMLDTLAPLGSGELSRAGQQQEQQQVCGLPALLGLHSSDASAVWHVCCVLLACFLDRL